MLRKEEQVFPREKGIHESQALWPNGRAGRGGAVAVLAVTPFGGAAVRDVPA